MKNLENYGVQEMSIKEMKETDGGFWWFIVAAVVIALIFANDGNSSTNVYINGEQAT